MTFGRYFFDLVFVQPNGPQNRGKICARSLMTFGRDFFDLVFAQPNGPQNNHPTQMTQNAPIKISARSPIYAPEFEKY